MNAQRLVFATLLIGVAACIGHAQIFGAVRGTVVDPQGAAVPGATVMLKANASAFTKTAQTALCPKCPVDSVIGSSSGYPITNEFLQRMHDHWF